MKDYNMNYLGFLNNPLVVSYLYVTHDGKHYFTIISKGGFCMKNRELFTKTITFSKMDQIVEGEGNMVYLDSRSRLLVDSLLDLKTGGWVSYTPFY